jgi:hypothetical protein
MSTSQSAQFDPSVGNDIFNHHGRQMIARLLATKSGQPYTIPFPFPSSDASFTETKKKELECVGILGAGKPSTLLPPTDSAASRLPGPAGLYTALILDDLGIPFKVIEGRERVGGRLYTYEFKNKIGAPYNYYDVGAMRFPETDLMTRVFRLFRYPPLNKDGFALEAKLQPYIFTNGNTFLSYNGHTFKQNALPPDDPFRSSENIKDADPRPYIAIGSEAIKNDIIKPFALRLLDDLKYNTKKGWEYMMDFDKYSTRAYMAVQYRPSSELAIPDAPLPTDVINWCETFETSTGGFDRALTDEVLESLAFGWNPENKVPKWFCIEFV